MEYEENLTRLEKVVEKLLRDLDIIQQDKNNLEASLKEKDEENRLLKEQIEQTMEDKSRIHQRVSSLIDSIEKWESSRSVGENEEESPADEAQDSSQGSLFQDSMTTE